MNNSYKKRFSPFLAFFLVITIFGVCTEEMQKTIDQAMPYELYGILDREKNAAFKEETALKNGFDQQALQKWNNLVECCHITVVNLVEKNQLPKQYTQYIVQLNETNDFIKNTINTIHTKYISLNQKNGGTLFEKINQLNKKDSSQDKLPFLLNIKKEINKHINTMSIVMSMALKQINAQVTIPAEWKLTIPATINEIFPCYKEFFASYYRAKKTSPQQLTSKGLIYFLKITKIFTSKCLSHIHDDAAKASALVDILEKIQYRIQEDMKKSIFNKSRKKMLDASEEIIQQLQTYYPQMITELYFKKLTLTNDKASIILFAEAKGLISILENIKKEINKIIAKK